MGVSGAKLLWKSSTVVVGKVPGFSSVRWYCKAEIWFLLDQYHLEIKLFIEECVVHGFGDVSTKRLLAVVSDPEKLLQLQLELAGVTATKSTYSGEVHV